MLNPECTQTEGRGRDVLKYYDDARDDDERDVPPDAEPVVVTGTTRRFALRDFLRGLTGLYWRRTARVRGLGTGCALLPPAGRPAPAAAGRGV